MSYIPMIDYVRLPQNEQENPGTQSRLDNHEPAFDRFEQRPIYASSLLEIFSSHRQMLFRIAYKKLGSVSDAEDIVQEVWLRWQRQDAAEILTPKAWLCAAVTRLCIDRLRSARYQREDSFGLCVPEPMMLAVDPEPNNADDIAYSLAMAFGRIVERLRPVERVVFLLHDVFGYAYADAAVVVGKDVAHCRQIARRAKLQLRAASHMRPPSDKARRLVGPFNAAAATGDLKELLALLNDNADLSCNDVGQCQEAGG